MLVLWQAHADDGGAVSTALSLWGDADQQGRYLPEFVGENAPAAALAMLEPRPLFDPKHLVTFAVMLFVAVTTILSPTFQPLTSSARVTSREPLAADAPSFTQVRLSGRPCDSHRPPQQTTAGHESLFIPST